MPYSKTTIKELRQELKTVWDQIELLREKYKQIQIEMFNNCPHEWGELYKQHDEFSWGIQTCTICGNTKMVDVNTGKEII